MDQNQQCRLPMSFVDRIMIQSEIDMLLDDEDTSKFNPYSLSPVTEDNGLENGEKEPRPAYKETKPLTSILESELYVSEVTFLKVKGRMFELLGPFGCADDVTVQIEVPGLNGNTICDIEAGRLKDLLYRYLMRVYQETDSQGWTTYYVLSAIDKRSLLKYCKKK